MNVSYTEAELKLAKEETAKYTVKKIIGKRSIKNRVHFQVWWKGYKKKESTYEPRVELLKDGLKHMIDAFELSLKNNK